MYRQAVELTPPWHLPCWFAGHAVGCEQIDPTAEHRDRGRCQGAPASGRQPGVCGKRAPDEERRQVNQGVAGLGDVEKGKERDRRQRPGEQETEPILERPRQAPTSAWHLT